MPAVNVWDDEYRKEIDALANCVSGADAGCDTTREYANCLHRIKGIRKSFMMEVSMMKAKDEKLEYESKARRYDIRVNSLKAEYDDILNTQKQCSVATPQPHVSQKAPVSANDKVLEDATKLQDHTVQSLQRTRAMVEQSNTVAYSSLSTLQVQHEQIKGIDRDLSKIDSYLVKSTKLVAQYAKGLATDRICQCLTALNMALVFILVIVVILKYYD